MVAVGFVRNTKYNPGIALGKDGRIDLTRALRNQHKGDAVLSSLLRKSLDRFTGGCILSFATVRDISVGFFAYQKHRIAFTFRRCLPQLHGEKEPSDDRTSGSSDLIGDTRKIDDTDGVAIAKELLEHVGQRVACSSAVPRRHHEAETAVADQAFDFADELVEFFVLGLVRTPFRSLVIDFTN